ncbi:unnamed protein product [Mytilus coruscus]|uniref:Uncharacterized protein n=1 Tax=Mytilus coruscus TaxID=42192 RepID=A0A6J8AV00_MYTCO|nr:unnamed protein product [Mytilus coruscus]
MTGRTDQAQQLIQNIPGIEQIQPSLLRRLTIPDDIKTLNIQACLSLPDGRFILSDFDDKQLLLFGNDGIFIREVVTFTNCPGDVCFVRNNTVAVTLGAAYKTVLVDIEKNEIIQTIELSHYCKGKWSEIVFHYTKEMSISHFENNVECYEINGDPLWTFLPHDLSNVNSIQGLTLDKNGFVYIASRKNNSIVVVSPDGQTSKTILSKSDGIKDPWAININRATGIMIVSSKIRDDSSDILYDTAFVYKI